MLASLRLFSCSRYPVFALRAGLNVISSFVGSPPRHATFMLPGGSLRLALRLSADASRPADPFVVFIASLNVTVICVTLPVTTVV